MKIAMASDHAGYELKEELKSMLQEQGHEVLDFGTNSKESCDLSDFVYPAALAVGKKEADRGIFVDGVGYGSALIANRIYGVTAAVCQDPFCAKLARQHTDSNVLCIGGKIIGSGIAHEIVAVWMKTEPITDVEKYVRRVRKVEAITEKHLKKLTDI
ncbi:MAG: RpiB/LacA/LacB family sugar-phosphate isomerase [Sporolactobacillus sp.]